MSTTIDEEDVERVIRDPATRELAAAALAKVRVGHEKNLPLPEALDQAAAVVGTERAHFWVEQIKDKGYLSTFVAALAAVGIPIQKWELGPGEVQTDDRELATFLARSASFRCLILVEDDVKGSGVLVGPSSALTAWHVVATAAPNVVPQPTAKIEVALADGRRIPAVLLTEASSPCGDMEWPANGGGMPKSDDEVKDRHDVALLRLKQPAGIHLSFASLVSPSYQYSGPRPLYLISYPEGEWRGIEIGKLKKFRNLTARWGYDVQGTQGGSSGGGCFDTSLRLAGIHQGRAQGAGRLVPVVRFDEMVRKVIADDEVPERLWSLDGTPESTLVVGRDGLFIGYHAAMRGSARVRGVWCRRTNLRNDVSGLPFTFNLLAKLVSRSATTRLVRVSFDALVQDLPQEIARRASSAGVQVDSPAAVEGVAEGQTEPEAVIADRSRRLALALEARARELGIVLWIFFEHPFVVFGDESRWALTAFVDQALRSERLRILLAGYEAMQMPGAQFENTSDAQGDGPPGLMVEYLSDVNQGDVRHLIELAAADMGCRISPERVQEWTNEALEGLKPVNGQYDSALRAAIASRLQPKLQQLRQTGDAG